MADLSTDGAPRVLSSAAATPRLDLTVIAGWLLVALPATVAIGPAVIDIVTVLLGLTFLAHSISTKDTSWLDETWVRVLGALWLFTIVRSLLTGPLWVSLGPALAWVRYPLLAVATIWVLREPVWRDRLLVSVALVCGFLSLDALFQAYFGVDIIGRPTLENRLTASMARPRLGITLAWFFLPAVFGLLQLHRPRLAIGMSLACLAAILLSGDRLAFLFAVAGLVLAALSIEVVRRRALIFGLLAAVLISGLLVLRPDVYARQVRSTIDAIQNIGSTHYGVIWSRALVMARASPVFGVGTNLYRDVCPDAAYGPVVRSNNNLEACAVHPHNIYLEWLVETGLVGAAWFVAGLGLIARRIWPAVPVLRTNFVFMALAISLALRLFPLGTATSMTRSWFSMPLWLMIGWLLAMAIDVTTQRQSKST
jgi:O-antigen ligase